MDLIDQSSTRVNKIKLQRLEELLLLTQMSFAIGYPCHQSA